MKIVAIHWMTKRDVGDFSKKHDGWTHHHECLLWGSGSLHIRVFSEGTMNWYSRAFPCPHRLYLSCWSKSRNVVFFCKKKDFFWDACMRTLGAKVQKWNISRCTFFSNFTFRFWSDTNVMFPLNIFITGVTRTQPSKDYCIFTKYWNEDKRLSKNITLSKYLHSCNK